MSRIRMFVAAVLASLGLMTFVATPHASAIIVHAEILEGVDPNSPPEPAPGTLLHLCLTIRPNPPVACVTV